MNGIDAIINDIGSALSWIESLFNIQHTSPGTPQPGPAPSQPVSSPAQTIQPYIFFSDYSASLGLVNVNGTGFTPDGMYGVWVVYRNSKGEWVQNYQAFSGRADSNGRFSVQVSTIGNNGSTYYIQAEDNTTSALSNVISTSSA